ncbi:hypothetical protein HanIR_Chr10g0472431 [Helianthus annuus]|nr:hypothetical protein HanIR_Chr10g0472431 [Helianthus annuus]
MVRVNGHTCSGQIQSLFGSSFDAVNTDIFGFSAVWVDSVKPGRLGQTWSTQRVNSVNPVDSVNSVSISTRGDGKYLGRVYYLRYLVLTHNVNELDRYH